ncbi:hypothetical protein [Arthrobacter sp. Ld5]|uniref:hypothetical protein n=1 Tax=Arthrobacter sp. Ld5 TaxID=649152 RepID=UPI003EC08CD2
MGGDHERSEDSVEHTEAVDLQVAIFETVSQARGLSVQDARRIFARALSSKNVTPPSGLWVDAAMTSAVLGHTYIISIEARRGAELILEQRNAPTTGKDDSKDHA